MDKNDTQIEMKGNEDQMRKDMRNQRIMKWKDRIKSGRRSLVKQKKRN